MSAQWVGRYWCLFGVCVCVRVCVCACAVQRYAFPGAGQDNAQLRHLHRDARRGPHSPALPARLGRHLWAVRVTRAASPASYLSVCMPLFLTYLSVCVPVCLRHPVCSLTLFAFVMVVLPAVHIRQFSQLTPFISLCLVLSSSSSTIYEAVSGILVFCRGLCVGVWDSCLFFVSPASDVPVLLNATMLSVGVCVCVYVWYLLVMCHRLCVCVCVSVCVCVLQEQPLQHHDQV